MRKSRRPEKQIFIQDKNHCLPTNLPAQIYGSVGVPVGGTGNLHSEDAAVSSPWRQAGVKHFTNRFKEMIIYICDKKYHVDREQFKKCLMLFENIRGFVCFCFSFVWFFFF